MLGQQQRCTVLWLIEANVWLPVTFAISLQLLPTSRICLSLSSSAGVQGVFVRLFLAFGSCTEASTGSVSADTALICASAPALVSAMWLICWLTLTDLRLRCPDAAGCVCCALIETSLFDWVAGAVDCKMGCWSGWLCCKA